MNARDRRRFDALLEQVIAGLPPGVRRLLDEMPVVVEDFPDERTLEDLGEEDELVLLGLHEGTPFTERSVDDVAPLPSSIHLYRAPIIDQAGGFSGKDADARVREEIRVTLLHEIGHQFGLDEDDLTRLGYE